MRHVFIEIPLFTIKQESIDHKSPLVTLEQGFLSIQLVIKGTIGIHKLRQHRH